MKFKQFMVTILIGMISTTFMGCGLLSKDSDENNKATITGTVYQPQASSNSNNMSMSLLLSVNGKTPLSDADVCLVDITTQKETSFCAKTNINGEYGIDVDSLTYWNGRAVIKSSKGKTQVFKLYDSSDTNVSDARSSIVAL